MARPQSFDRTDVLTKALDVFWKKGFEDASVQDLVDATGLNRGSLYNSFGDKDDLFAEVMALYKTSSPVTLLTSASEDADITELFEAFFQRFVDRAEADLDHKGCLFTNTAAGLYGCSDDMAKSVCSSLDDMEGLIVRLIERGQDQDDITSTADPLKLARFLISSAQGINVMARTGASTDALQDIADQTLVVLNP
jgi:TetR/AcrR family transcriptional repressor of nem operon